jgi:hypothetical protein
MQPLPPSPALTRIFASSMNIENQGSGVRDQRSGNWDLRSTAYREGQTRDAVFLVYLKRHRIDLKRHRIACNSTFGQLKRSKIGFLRRPMHGIASGEWRRGFLPRLKPRSTRCGFLKAAGFSERESSIRTCRESGPAATAVFPLIFSATTRRRGFFLRKSAFHEVDKDR